MTADPREPSDDKGLMLDRNGARQPPLPRLGVLKPVASFLVQLATRWIVRGHENTLVSNIRKRYELREANSRWGSDERNLLRRARIEATRIEGGLRSNPIGLPALLLGAAFVSGIVSGLFNVVRTAFEHRLFAVLVALGAVLLLVSLGWVALYSAAVARKRIRLSTDQPMRALWDTIGAAGDPPRDQSFNLAFVAIALLIIAAIVVPAAIVLVVRLD